MNKKYCSILSKEALLYNIQYHILNCETKEVCIDVIKTLLENFEEKENNDRKDE